MQALVKYIFKGVRLTYYIVLCFHLLAAIIFIGFLFADVVIFSALKSLKDASKAKELIGKRAVKIMPFMLLILLLTGGYMLQFNMPMPKLLMLKVFFACLIFAGVIYSLSSKIFGYKPNAYFKKNFHVFALILGFLIVICAKLMAVVG